MCEVQQKTPREGPAQTIQHQQQKALPCQRRQELQRQQQARQA
jgi:hypothetical protein